MDGQLAGADHPATQRTLPVDALPSAHTPSSAMDAMKRRPLLIGIIGLGLSGARRWADAANDQRRPGSADGLAPASTPVAAPGSSLQVLANMVEAAHAAYQRGAYAVAAEPIMQIVSDAAAYEIDASADARRRASALSAAVYVLASRIAAKSGDAAFAWVTADRALRAACTADDRALSCVAIYQMACALAKETTRLPDASAAIAAGIDVAASTPASQRAISARGALELLGAVVSAKLGENRDAARHLAAARALAAHLGHDGNHLWTAFGPTNVELHEVSVALALGQPDHAVRLGEAIDTSRLPAGLIGRRAQVHVDVASAWTQAGSDDGQAFLHLLEAERLSPEITATHHRVRIATLNLLRRHHGQRLPGLQAFANRAGIAA